MAEDGKTRQQRWRERHPGQAAANMQKSYAKLKQDPSWYAAWKASQNRKGQSPAYQARRRVRTWRRRLRERGTTMTTIQGITIFDHQDDTINAQAAKRLWAADPAQSMLRDGAGRYAVGDYADMAEALDTYMAESSPEDWDWIECTPDEIETIP